MDEKSPTNAITSETERSLDREAEAIASAAIGPARGLTLEQPSLADQENSHLDAAQRQEPKVEDGSDE